MTIEYSDAWLIQSIFHTEKNSQDFKLTDMLAYADYVNHAIMSFHEFGQGLKKLIALGLIKENEKNLVATDAFKDWWNKKNANKKRIYGLAELEQIKSFLEKLSKDVEWDYDTIEIQTNEIDFDHAVNDYLGKMK